ncbi:YDG domain-containing protein [[Ruminococcus] lactaris]|uniref:YDG domain-containing protein n=1 Tax=[Ruminococcus] lactaris TaxID=46228 RepID=UPI00242FC819|nr:YDG domain-containing protein [[Ruminococcus] lactaris]
MKKRVLSLFMVLVLCLTLLPTAAFAEGEDVSISGGVIGGGETGGEGGGIYVAPGSPTEGGGGTYIPGEDTRTEIWCVSKPDSIGRGYDGTTDGGTIPIDLTFTDGTNEIKLKEGTGFTAKKTFDSADAGWHTVTVEIALIGEAAVKYKLKAGEETFTIGGNINKAYPDLTVTLSKTACTAGEKLLPLLSVEGAPEDAEVTYYYLASAFKSWAGSSDVEGSEAMPKIDENTAISEPGTYYVYAKTGETTNYEEDRSATVELTVNEAVVEAASITKADGTDGGTYESLPAALNAAQDGDTVKLLANHTTNWSDVEAGEYATLAVVKKTLTLDLNGMTVDYLTVGDVVPDEEGGILDSYDGNLTVVDNIQGGSHGKIKDLEFVKGSLAIQGGQIGDSDGGLTCNVNSGNATISGGTVLGLKVSEGATVTVSGGSMHQGQWINNGTLNITGGTFGSVEFYNNSGTIAISGGTFNTLRNYDNKSEWPIAPMPLLVPGHAFYDIYDENTVKDGSSRGYLQNVTVKEHTHTFENGKCACGVKAIVTDNNVNYYSTLQAALDAAANDNTITTVTLQQDLAGEEVKFRRAAAGALTLNMNGHKLEATAGVPLTVIGGELIIEGAGQVNQNTASNAAAFPAISLTGGKLVIKGGLSAQGGYDSNGRKPAIRAEEEGELDLQGNVSLNGGLTILDNAKLTNLLTKGTFYVDASETGNAIAITDSEVYNKALDLLAKDHAFYRADSSLADAGGARLSTGRYTIKSHTCSYTQDEAHGIAYCKCGRSHAHRDLSEEKSVLVNGVCPICGYHCPHNTVDETTLSCSDCGAKVVAKVEVEGSEPTYAFDLASAFQNAVNGTTIKLLANEMLPSDTYVSKTLTLDLDGHSLSGYSLNVGGLTPTSQVRTGNLTVIDSSGGNGAVGVAVRNGGTLVFNPKNDHTTLLQLEVWGGTVKLYGGKISRSGLRLNNNITLGNLLPEQAGLAYYRGDTQLTLAEATSQTCDLMVKSCSHGGKNGFDNNSTACPYCNAPAVAEAALNNGEGRFLWRRFADLQTALDADRDGGAEFKLLTDVTGDYTINGTQDTALDLNGYSIKGTVTVKGIKGDYITTTLSNTKNTTTASIDKVVACDGAELAGSKYPAVIGTLTLAEGATWKTILNDTALGYKMLNADGTHKWYARDDVKGSQLNNVIINRLPITSKTLNLKVDGKNLTGNSPKVERGTTVQLCASCNAKDVTVTFSILKTGETTPITLSGNDVQYTTVGTGTTKFYVAEYAFNDVGSYTISFTATKDGYTVTSTPKKLTVTKPNLSNAEITFPNGNEAAFNYVSATGVPTFVVKYNGTELEENVDFVITSGDSTYDVGPCTLTIKATDNGNYTGQKTAEWTVRPLKVAASVGDIIKTYDGTTNLPKDTKITFKSADSYYTGATLRLAKGTDYELLDAKYDSANASTDEKTISFTIKLKNEGYVFEDGTTQKDFTLNGADFDDKTFQINKATVPMNNPTGTLNIINGTCQTYTYDFNNILPGLPGGKYGTISYGQADISLVSQSGYYYDETIVEFKKGVLTLAQFYAKDGKMTGKIGTVKVNVTTTNYADFQLKLVLYAVDQIKPEPDGTITATPITYGDTLSKSEISGKMKDDGKTVEGTFEWTDPSTKPDKAGDYEADWTFTPAAGYEKYATVTGTVTIKVNKATPTFIAPTAQENLTYTGQEQALITAGMTDHGTMQYSLTENGTYSQDSPTGTDAGAYTVWYRVIGDANHNDTAPASVAVRIGKKPLTITGVTAASKPYDGTTNADISSVTFDNVTLNRGTDYTVTANFDDASVDSGKNITATVTLMEQAAKNYALEQSSFPTTGSIIKAAAPDFTKETVLTIVNGHEKTYTVTLPALPTLETPKEYGAPTYELGEIKLNDGYYTSGAKVENGELTLPIQKNDVETTGSVGTVTVVIKSANYEDITLTVNVSAKNRITPTGTPTLSKNAIIYGDALNAIALSGKLHDNVNNVDVDGTFEWVDGTHIPVVGNGTYAAEWIFEPTDTEKYLTVSGRSNITVEKARQYGKLSMAGYTYGKTPSTPTLTDQTGDLNAQVTYSYAAADSGSVQTWDISNPPALNAGTYRMYASIGDTDNYYGFEAVYCEFVVAKATPTYTVPTGLTAKYGQTLADVTLPDGWSWMDSSESVGGASTAAKTFQAKFTPKDTENYNTVENIELEVTVNKADGGNLKTVELEQKYTDASDHTYTPDWAGLPAGQDWTFSSEASIVLPKQDFAADGNLLTYAISGGKAGDKITLILKASCDNYEDFTITLNVTLTEKDDQKPLTITGNTSVIYGEKLTLTTTGGSGMGAVTYRIDNAISTGEATIDPNTGVLTPVKVGSVSVIATKAGDNNYNDVTSAPFVLMIKPATPTGEPKYTKITTSGKTLKDVTLTIEGSTLNPSDGKLEWVDDKGEPLPDDTTVKANTTYKWCFTPDDDNYTTLTGEVELYHKSSSGGGWYDSCYTIKATAGAGGSISPSGNVSVREGGDQTFTITPDKGYAVANVKIDGKSIGAVKSYTFENVSSPHTIEAIFVKGTASASTGDSSNLPLWSALLLASTLALAGAVHLKRKRAR